MDNIIKNNISNKKNIIIDDIKLNYNKGMKSLNNDNISDKSPNLRYLKFKNKIDGGSFKKIYLAFDTINGIEVIWNEINISNLSNSAIKKLSNEISILKSCDDCNYIINIFDYWIDSINNNMVFITERATSGNLKEFILKIDKIKLRIIKKWCKQILYGIKYLHNKNIIHRDIKCDNIFINGHSGNILIGDFGSAKLLSNKEQKTHTILGTPNFMAPEIYNELYNKKIDIYSFGMCMLEMITKKSPYEECNNFPDIWKTVKSQIKPKILNKIKNKNIKNIINKCIDNENQRPCIDELLNNKFWDDSPDDELDNYLYTDEEYYKLINDSYDNLNNSDNPDIVDNIIIKTEKKANIILKAVEEKADEIINKAKIVAKQIIYNANQNKISNKIIINNYSNNIQLDIPEIFNNSDKKTLDNNNILDKNNESNKEIDILQEMINKTIEKL